MHSPKLGRAYARVALRRQVMWAITMLTAVGMAILNFVTILSMRSGA